MSNIDRSMRGSLSIGKFLRERLLRAHRLEVDNLEVGHSSWLVLSLSFGAGIAAFFCLYIFVAPNQQLQ